MVKRSASRAAALLLGSVLASAFPLGVAGQVSGQAEDPATVLSAGAFVPRTLPTEAPKSLFAVDLDGEGGEADAELDIRGSWEASLLAEASLEAGGGGLALSEAQPLLFTQRPDLFLSFLLFKKVFVEARVSEDLAEARYSFGYRGGEGEALKEVRAGNDGISFPALPFLSFGSGSRRSFGAAAKVETEAFSGSAMLRYDQADRVEKRFVGRSEVTETVVAASGFQRGRYFATTSGAAANLVLYVESSAGTFQGSDGKAYRRLEAGEYSYSAATGFIALAAAATTRVAASYDGSAGTLTVGGQTGCVLLFEPEVFGANTEVLCRYPVLGASSAEVFVRDRASGLRDDDYEARFDSGGFIEVTKGGQTVPTHADYRQPFLSEMADLYTTDFSEDDPDILAALEAPLLTKEIVVRRLAAAAEITIDKDVIEGSVEVRRNGVPDYAFTVDADSGLLKLASEPGLEEEILVSYLRESSERRAGSLAAGLAGVFDLGEERAAWAALGLRWSVPGQSYAEGGTSNPGSVVLTAGERDGEGRFRHKAALAGSWTTEEASGRYRVEGMAGAGSYATSFGVVSALPAGTEVAELEEADLEGLFPAYIG
ncbi:MAG TPA: hypothetical protein PLG14_03800, partial [Spirochaetales bacterium]|nr:hypothetical protein [Spirochaetales bacterium]